MWKVLHKLRKGMVCIKYTTECTCVCSSHEWQSYEWSHHLTRWEAFIGCTPLCAELQRNKCRPAVHCRCCVLSSCLVIYCTPGGIYIKMGLGYGVYGGGNSRLVWWMLEWSDKASKMKRKERWLQCVTDRSSPDSAVYQSSQETEWTDQ